MSLTKTETDHKGSTTPSPLRAWCFLVYLCWQRQLRSQLTVWFALILLVFTAGFIGLQTARNRWGMHHWRHRDHGGAVVRSQYQEYLDTLQKMRAALPASPPASAIEFAVINSYAETMKHSSFFVFSRFIVFSVFLSFLLPIWSLSFATESIGGERESRNLLWLLSRPLSRPSIYLAKFVSVLPWAIGLNLGGFVILCLAAGKAGYPALQLYLPAVLCGSLAFCALFHLFGALFRHAAVIGLVYSFFLEMILGNMPGNMKRISIGFYTRCMMFERAHDVGFEAAKPSIYAPVSGTTALLILVTFTVVLLIAGMFVFARTEYQDAS